MQTENPTGEAGASTLERLESYLSAGDAPEERKEVPEVAAKPEQAESKEVPNVEPESDAQGEDDGPQINLSDVAKVLGVDESLLDVDDDGQAIIKTKIDGQEGSAKLADFLKSYQLKGHVDNESRAVAEQRKALQAEREQFQQTARQQAEYVGNLAQAAQAELMQEYQSIDWSALSRDDPARYVSLQHEFQQRNAKVQGLAQRAQQLQQHHAEQAQQSRVKALAEEDARLSELIPDWADSAAKNKGKAELASWLTKLGVPQKALESLESASLIAALRKGMLFEQQAEAKHIAEKKVRLAPKLVKPGQSTDKATRDAQGIAELKSSIRKSGGKTGIAQYLLATGKV